MGAVGVLRIERHGPVDGVRRRSGLARLDLGEGVLAQEPPVLAVMRGERGGKGELLRLAPGLAAEADQPEDAGAGLGDQGIARMVQQVGSDRLVGRRTLAGDKQAEGVEMRRLALRRSRCKLRRPRGRSGHVVALAHGLTDAGEADLPEREIRIGGDGGLERFLRTRLGGQETVDAVDIRVAGGR
ncbi:MAG: hypothetical protein ACMVO3_21650 [Thalassobaculum sp.]